MIWVGGLAGIQSEQESRDGGYAALVFADCVNSTALLECLAGCCRLPVCCIYVSRLVEYQLHKGLVLPDA